MASKDNEAVIKSADMTDEMITFAIAATKDAFKKEDVERNIAMHIKKAFDTRFGGTWHVIVGKDYGSYVSHETKNFLYFYLGEYAMLIFKAG
mmetsp:Transcript_10313/g.11373  ORF Transcript_10313/g.11373 Transcript_10313/m.11373 type:complete len:92 (-) Transcript_10313:61-336(-)